MTLVNNILFIVAVLIIGLLTFVWIPKWMLRRNIHKVIRIFQEENAVGIQNAMTAEELGLEKISMIQAWAKGKMFNRRDWKPMALNFLIENNVVFITQEGKLYITEKSLAGATWLNFDKQ